MSVSFGAWLKQQRAQASVGLRQFAHLIGYSPTFVSRVENGDLRPGRAFVEAVAIEPCLECREPEVWFEAGIIPAVMEDALLNDRDLFQRVWTECLAARYRKGAA